MKIISLKDARKKQKAPLELPRGGLWEGNEVTIYFDYPMEMDSIQEYNCPHLGEKYTVRTPYKDGRYNDEIVRDCPRVIVMVNEGGYNSTGVCLDCVIEQLGEEKKK